jgi:polyvinyl alcohol dehydrogenase (cytochrome)
LGENGPDFDFGASALLIPLGGGKDILVAGQKSGTVYGMDPDKGTVIWRSQLGAGSALGGVEFGMATDGKLVFVANADMVTQAPNKRPGLFALDPATGKELWYAATPKVACGWSGGSRCYNSNSAAPIVIPGAVIAGSTDGWLRAYDPKDGKVLWGMDTAGRTYDTINGVKAQRGGVIDAGGAIVADGMVFVMSGYVANVGGVPDNVLLALSVEGK